MFENDIAITRGTLKLQFLFRLFLMAGGSQTKGGQSQLSHSFKRHLLFCLNGGYGFFETDEKHIALVKSR